MPTTITAKVARTAKGLSHVNRLKMPGFGVEWLRLIAAGGGKSNSYLPTGFPSLTDGSDYFCFAPGVASDQVTISYKIGDPAGQIGKGRLELFRPHEDTPFWTLPLVGDSITDGEHTDLTWDGGLKRDAADNKWSAATFAKADDFPDQYITVGSPYKLKLTVEGGLPGMPAVAWTYFHILVQSITLELGPKKSLKEDRDRTLWDTIYNGAADEGGWAGALPTTDVTAKLFISSNLFKTNPDGSEMYDNSGYTIYETAWGDGPGVPLFAKVTLRDSTGKEANAPKALGNVRFLWDWEDVREDTSQNVDLPKTFIEQALDYDAQKTHPKNDNCHVDRGGKRGPAAKPLFPAQTGYPPANTLTDKAFPFKVEPCTKRTWAAFSYGWGSGALAGKTGTLFQPSRMAGDTVKVTVYLAVDKAADGSCVLDTTDDAPLKMSIKQTPGAFQIWRKLQISKYVRKTTAISSFFGSDQGSKYQGYFTKAFLEVENLAASDTTVIDAATYNTEAGAALVAAANDVIGVAVDTSADQYAATPSAFACRTFADLTIAVQAFLSAQLLAAAAADPANAGVLPALLQTQANTQAATQANGWMTVRNIESAEKYSNTLTNLLADPCVATVDKLSLLNGASDGIVIIHFDHLHSVVRDMVSTGASVRVLNGMAADLTGRSVNRCGFIFWKNAADTFGHEIGHHLFLPHAPSASPNGAAPYRHDQTDNGCLMSYNRPRPNFCGLCQLRLRGWNPGEKTTLILDPHGTRNKRT